MLQGVKNLYHLCVVILASIVHQFPGRGLLVIGVTGTDGKTTTVNLIYHLLKTAGREVSMISTTGAIIGEKHYDVGFHVTTPRDFHLRRLMKEALLGGDNREKILVLEVSSHSLDQNQL